MTYYRGRTSSRQCTSAFADSIFTRLRVVTGRLLFFPDNGGSLAGEDVVHRHFAAQRIQCQVRRGDADNNNLTSSFTSRTDDVGEDSHSTWISYLAMPQAPHSVPSPHAVDNNAYENVFDTDGADPEKHPLPAKVGFFSRARMLGPVKKDHGDLPLLVCSFVSGLVDGASFRNWGMFVAMQTGMLYEIHSLLYPR